MSAPNTVEMRDFAGSEARVLAARPAGARSAPGRARGATRLPVRATVCVHVEFSVVLSVDDDEHENMRVYGKRRLGRRRVCARRHKRCWSDFVASALRYVSAPRSYVSVPVGHTQEARQGMNG